MATTKPHDPKHNAVVEQWHHLIKRSLRENTSFKAFEGNVLRLLLRSPLDGSGVLDAWAASHDGGFTIRPRQIKYFETLLQLKLFTHADVLQRVLNTAPATIFAAEHFLIKSGAAKGEYRQCLEAVMLERLAYQLLQMRELQGTSHDRTFNYRTRRPLLALVSAFVQATGTMNLIEGPALAIGTELGKYVGVFINDLSITGILASEDGGPPKALKRVFGHILPQFINILSGGSNEVAQSLALLQQQSGLYESPNSDGPQDDMAESLNAITFQQSVVDVPLVTSRAALYVFLNAMLAGRPICDDPATFTFLNSRYNGTVDSLIVDLVTASFDVLANAINRTEPTDSINIYRSFLINKVPVLLESYSHMLYPPQTIESCITSAIRSMDPSTDPFGTQAFDLLSSSGMLSEARQEFLFACALYALIPESSIETILGDVTMQNLPESGKYDRANLVAQCTANPARIDELVNELENFEGQAAEISAALTQIIRDCCAGKDSITLKGICNTLSRKMNALDVLLLFEEPKSFLQPLCELLDTWPDAEEHSEYHPVYDEFGSIFLLILIFRQRFDLQVSEMGITTPDSFIRSYFRHGLAPIAVQDFAEAQKTQLGGWVKGLYDSEGNLSDEPMSTCGPKAFHLLIATLFDQSLKANQAGLIPFSTLQGGLGYFLEPFLLPALVTGLGWAARKFWETPTNKVDAPQHLDHLIPLLNTLIRPSSLSPEAKSLHESVLITSSAPLERALAHVQSLHPRRTDLEPLRAALAPRIPPLRLAAHASPAELENWASGTPGGFVPGLRHILRTLVAWSAQAQAAAVASGSAGQNTASAPPQFTFRQLVHGSRILGGPSALTALLDEGMRLIHGAPNMAAQAGANAGTGAATAGAAAGASTTTYDSSLVIDVFSSLLSAPQAQAPRALLPLRQALSLAAQDAYTLSRSDRSRAELVVRLERKVGSQCLSESAAQGQGQVQGGPGEGQGADSSQDAIDGMMGVESSTAAPQGGDVGDQARGGGGTVDDVLMGLGGDTAGKATGMDVSLEDELGLGAEGAEGMMVEDFNWD